jgi:hypothetical protein
MVRKKKIAPIENLTRAVRTVASHFILVCVDFIIKTVIFEQCCCGDLLCPRCRVRAVQTGGDTHSKMAPTTGTHSILVPETELAQVDFYCMFFILLLFA